MLMKPAGCSVYGPTAECHTVCLCVCRVCLSADCMATV